MKLPDFYQFEGFLNLKRRMGIPADGYGSFAVEIDYQRLSEEEIGKLDSGEGIDVGLSELSILPDGTLAFKNARVLLYIRDVSDIGRGIAEGPRFHVAHCETLKSMAAAGRAERYVIATEATGSFRLNIERNGRISQERKQLWVCQNCLSSLKFDGFQSNWGSGERTKFVRSFTPAAFFSAYPKSLHRIKPQHNDATAPINDYSPDFSEISTRIRSSSGWKCQRCTADHSDAGMRRYLHVHHINGRRWDNDRRNLKVLCISCHGEEPFHGHLRALPEYHTYRKMRGLQ